MNVNKVYDNTYKKLNRRALEITLDAFEKSKEARELGEKLGSTIEGSKYYRCFCCRCGTPMRTYASQLFSDHWCRYCSPGHQGVSAIIRISRADKERFVRKDVNKEDNNMLISSRKTMPQNFRDRMTEHQWGVYFLLHPQGSDLTIQEAAKKLNISTTSVFLTIQRIKEKCPYAFGYENEIKESMGCESGAHNIEYVFEGNKAKAKQNKIEFTIPFNDFMNIVQLECFICGRHPDEIYKGTRVAYYRKSGYRFSYGFLWRLDMSLGFTVTNTTCICGDCIKRKKLEAKRRNK